MGVLALDAIARVHACDSPYRLDIVKSRLYLARGGRQTRTVLHEFLEPKRGDITARTKVKIATRPARLVTEAELTDGVPHQCSLKGLNDLIERTLAEVRLESTARRRDTIVLTQFVKEVAVAASMDAKVHRHELTITRVEEGVAVQVDQRMLATAVAHLLQNAFKFTRAPGRVWLRTRATVDRVFIDIEDECGGLPPGQAAELFHPFEQRSTDRSGLGLSISRKAVQSIGGDIHVRNLPGKACIFTIALPRKVGPALRACNEPL
jgi:signal transduction histidine kinase